VVQIIGCHVAPAYRAHDSMLLPIGQRLALFGLLFGDLGKVYVSFEGEVALACGR